MARTLKVVDDVLIDRHYRGAIVHTGTKIFALPEEAVQILERIQRGETVDAGESTLQALIDLEMVVAS